MKLPAYMLRPLWAVFALVAMTACRGAIYDDEGDCTAYYRIRFRYDRNMKFADAFASEVKAVQLYVFDRSGALVLQQQASGAELCEEGYLMPVELVPGDYDLLAWCGEGLTDGGASFTLPESGQLETLGCTMTRSHAGGAATVDVEGGLKPLYHGYLAAQHFPDGEGTHIIEMPLCKNTNAIRVVLQQQAGEGLTAEDFDFEITDNNGLMAWNNELLADETLVYPAWHVAAGTAEVAPEGRAAHPAPAPASAAAVGAAASAPAAGAAPRDETTSVSVVVAELTVGRLVREGHNPILTVRDRASGETVFSIPLIDYVLLVKGYYNRTMSDQEYLDRQDDYALTFFLDSGRRWIDAYLYINSWYVVLHDVEI